MHFIDKIKFFLYELLRLKTVDKDFVVVRMDGGLASQIAFWALGCSLENKGYKVKYDLSWFVKNGKDGDGVFARNFDLDKAFPDIRIEEASPFEVFYYKRHYKDKSETIDHVTAPSYLAGYYDRWAMVVGLRDKLRSMFQPPSQYFSDQDLNVLKQIEQSEHSCGVHVRRGDLAKSHSVYGKSVEVDYFLQAIEKIKSEYPDTTFYFFSDEINWVRDEIVPKLENTKYYLVDGNGSDKGYIDLYLLSRCESFISSQGSFAKYARLLKSDSALIVEPDSNFVFSGELADNAIVIQNCGV